MFANESSFVHLIYLQIHYFGVFWAAVDNPLVHTLQVTANQRTYYLCKLKFRFEKYRLQIYASSISENYTKLSLFFSGCGTIALVFLLKPSTACRTGFTLLGENEPVLKTAIASPELDTILFLSGIVAQILSSLFCSNYKV